MIRRRSRARWLPEIRDPRPSHPLCHLRAPRSNLAYHPRRMALSQPPATPPSNALDQRAMFVRIALVLVAFGVCFGGLWLLLPIVRVALLPAVPEGAWVLGPPRPFRFAACAVLCSLLMPLVFRPIGARWRAADIARRGAPMDPNAQRPQSRVGMLLKGGLLFAIYAIGAGFYVTSSTEVHPDKLVVRSLFSTRTYAMTQVRSLERNPPVGGQPERFVVRFDDNRTCNFTEEDEGATRARVEAIAAHLAARTSLPWQHIARR